jgi:hypothetical protein
MFGKTRALITSTIAVFYEHVDFTFFGSAIKPFLILFWNVLLCQDKSLLRQTCYNLAIDKALRAGLIY